MDNSIVKLPNKLLPHTKKSRLYYFLIWGHGLQYKKDILSILQEHPSFDIIYIKNHKIKNIKTFVKQIYAHDYAPFHHLKEKTRYLLKTPSEVQLIIIRNNTPNIDFLGEDSFRHEECLTIKSVKEQIRDQFNPRENGKRSEHHVIHACDNPNQLHQLLLDLNYPNGYFYFEKTTPSLTTIPFYLNGDTITLKKVPINNLYASILNGKPDNISHKLLPLDQTPHYLCLTKNHAYYQEYLDNYFGIYLKTNYSLKKFLNLHKSFTYLENNFKKDLILVKQLKQGRYQILDGLHRSTILKLKNIENVIVGIIND